MKLPRIWLLVLGFGSVTSASAQWRNVAPNLVAGTAFGGAMQYRAGIIWAGGNNLWRSTDLGASWKASGSFTNAMINDIAFFDAQNGLIGTNSDGVYHTSDSGKTWQHVLAAGAISKVSFNGSRTILHALDFSGIFYASTNGGVTWTSSNASNGECRSFATASDGTIYVQAANIVANPYSGAVLRSNDLGKTWTTAAGTMDGDCHTLAADSCDPNQLYLVNEEIYTPSDSLAQIFLSTNGGDSWQTVDSHHSLFYSGALATTGDAIFAGTLESSTGTYRSVDRGQTWESIGGPGTGADSRNIAAINQNYVLAMDPSGSIWLTTNGGGDSVAYTGPFVGSVAFSAKTLFAGDTLRCDSAASPLYIYLTGCHPPIPEQYQITGPDSASFRVIDPSPDSLVVDFISQKPGAQNATLVVTLADGSDSSIALAGFSEPPEQLAFDATSLSSKTDTIGGDVSIPIKIDGLSKPESIELVLHYPLPDLVYDGSFDRFGAKVDIPGEQWPGRSKLRILNDTPGKVAAYAKFNVFSDTAYHPEVTFDSVTIPTAATPCDYAPPPAATATIYPLEACGDQMLSRWIHLGVQPVLDIRPNPTSGEIFITPSDDAGPVTIEVFDMLGTLRSSERRTLSKGTNAELMLPRESGMYYLRVLSRTGETNLPVVVSR